MKLIRGLKNLKILKQGCVATIGNFDGVHLGHQKVLQNVVAQAERLHVPAILITFEPLPQEYFLKDKAAGRLLRLRDKLILLQKSKIDQVVCLRFNNALANLSATDFVQKILLDRLNIRYLVVGDDFRFGKGREGDFTLLQNLGQQYDFEVVDTPTLLIEGERIGSSRVRQALALGNLAFAEQLLGRKYTMSGHVVHGGKLGRQLGVPTVNLPLYGKKPPFTGIFVVQVRSLNQEVLPGVASLGIRPTVNGKDYLLEVHLLGFNQEIYGHYLSVEFLQKLRDEVKFDSLDALKTQMHQDIVAAKKFFA